MNYLLALPVNVESKTRAELRKILVSFSSFTLFHILIPSLLFTLPCTTFAIDNILDRTHQMDVSYFYRRMIVVFGDLYSYTTFPQRKHVSGSPESAEVARLIHRFNSTAIKVKYPFQID